MPTVQVPPIKCQGIKTKLVPFIQKHLVWDEDGVWLEPFLGSGVVGVNINPKRAIFADTNPHLIAFYQQVNSGDITSAIVKHYLEVEGKQLATQGQDYYYHIRERFNEHQQPLDFLFLTRAGFNGLIRFNQKGGFNVPFNHKPERFSKAYITKVVNQVKAVERRCTLNDWQFICQDFEETIANASSTDFIYCDPPYAGRHADYFNQWDEAAELRLFRALNKTPAKFMLSTWHSNQHRDNPYVEQLWSQFHLAYRSHFYHVGAKEKNRKPMLEALVMNYAPPKTEVEATIHYQQGSLW